jgi:DNA-binding transcriptional ArsR family regulator
MNRDPLADLLLDASEVDRARLATALSDILGIDTTSGRVVLKPGFNRLSARNKLLAFLLGRKVAMLLGKAGSEEVAPKDISRETGIPSGTVNPKLKELREAHLVSQTNSSEYYVAPHQMLQALDELEEGAE